jgi:hypothetical protein
MTIEELLAREGVRHTLASYNMAGDRARVDDFAAVFAEDAVFEPGEQRIEGREAIRRWIGGWERKPEAAATVKVKAKFIRHNLTTCQIEMTGPETAKSRTYFIAYTDVGPDHSGYYVDEFRKVGDRWLISHRRVRTDWRNPDSVFIPSS